MQHETHISEESTVGNGIRIGAIIAVLVALCAVGAYVVYGSGMI